MLPIVKNSILFKPSILIVCIVLLTLVVDFDGLYGQDAYEYLRYSKALTHFFQSGTHPGDYFWPLYYPIFGALLTLITKSPIISLQLISIASLAVSTHFLKRIIDTLYARPKQSTLYVFLFFVLSPYILKQGISIMSDLLALSFLLIAWYYLMVFNANLKARHLYIGVSFSLLSIMTRYPAFVILLPLLLQTGACFFKHKQLVQHLFGLVPIALLIMIPHFYIRMENPSGFIQHEWIKTWNISHLFEHEFTTIDGTQHNRFLSIFYIFFNILHPGYMFAGVFFICALKKQLFKNKNILLLMLSILIYAFFLGGIPFQNKRFLLLSFPLILIVLYPSFNSVLSRFKKQSYLLICSTILIQIVLLFYVLQPLLVRNKLEKALVHAMAPYQNNKLYSFDVDIALQGRGLKFEYKNMFLIDRIRPETGDYVLFNPKKFEVQWKDKTPMKNWNRIVNNHHLEPLLNRTDGWALYRISEPKK